MCFIIEQRRNPKLYKRFIDKGFNENGELNEESFVNNEVFSIAHQDIICYKILQKSNINYTTIYYSLFYPVFQWIIDELREESHFSFRIKTKEYFISNNSYVEIHNSFHAYNSLKAAKNFSTSDEVIAKFVIPKDSYYLKCGDYVVSDKIIFKKIVKK